MKYRLPPVFLSCTLLLLSVAATATEEPFAPSCKAQLSADFDHAVTLLHSFEYPETTGLFRKILQQDPDCAMARWGIAMSIWHPLWAPPSAAELSEGAALLAPIDEALLSDREALYVHALRAFFSDTNPSHHRQRVAAYTARMQQLYERHLDNTDAVAFYALSLLALASTDPADKSYSLQYKAGSILAWLRETQPGHPGALHYTIHSYDYPGLAHLALGAAMIYADAAPDSAHAQHMPSHIFTRLGLWNQSISSNHDSTASATEYTHRAGLSGHYDEGLHSIDYLMYAYLQTARDDDAARLLASLGQIGKTNVDNFKVAYTYAASPARYALERRQWREASELELSPGDFPWEQFPWANSMHHFARALGAARSANLERARTELGIIHRLKSAMSKDTLAYWREEVFVQEDAVSSWIAYAEGNTEAALAMAQAAADREDAVDKHPVTPGEILPARELYADMLLEAGRSREALDQYQRVLNTSPNRYNAVLGAARAAQGATLHEVATLYYSLLLEIAGHNAASRDSLEEARRFVSGETA